MESSTQPESPTAAAQTAGVRALIARVDARLSALTRTIAGLTGWKRRFAALAAGAATALAFAPFYILPLMAAGFASLVLLIDGAAAGDRPRRAAFGVGWFFGFGFFLLGVYWIALSFFVQAEEFAWMSPFVVIGMPSFLGLFTGAAVAVSAALWRRGWRRILLFAAIFMAFEYARGHVLTGLPWNLPGQALAGAAVGGQLAAWLGVYGLSLLVVALAAAPAAFAPEGAVLKGAAIAVGGLALIYAIGAARLALPGPGAYDNIFVRIVQPAIPQRQKIDPDKTTENFLRQLDLSEGPVKGTTYVIWPENAAPLLDEAPSALKRIEEDLPDRAILVSGMVRRDVDARGKTHYYNSLGVFPETAAGRVPVATYDKHHLVPFGEYLPLQGFLRAVGLAQLAPYDEGFTPGAGPATLRAGGTSFSPLICYEAIFPGEIYPKGARPDWLVAVTNDAWFGDSSGPRQHLDQARLRSIEEGLPMARSANTGISTLIDAKGRTLEKIRLYRAGRIDARLPKPLPPTLYARFGDAGFFALFLIALGAGLAPRRRARVRR